MGAAGGGARVGGWPTVSRLGGWRTGSRLVHELDRNLADLHDLDSATQSKPRCWVDALTDRRVAAGGPLVLVLFMKVTMRWLTDTTSPVPRRVAHPSFPAPLLPLDHRVGERHYFVSHPKSLPHATRVPHPSVCEGWVLVPKFCSVTETHPSLRTTLWC